MNLSGVNLSGVSVNGATLATLRSLLSASGQSAYDAAATDNWFTVSSTDYAAAVSGLTSVTKYVMTDAQVSEAGSVWASAHAQAFPSTIATVPSGVYLFGFVCRPGGTGTATPLISTTHKGTYTAISNNATTPSGVGTRSYYLRKASTATSATSYVGLVCSTTSYMGTTTFNPGAIPNGGYDNTVPYSTWTAWNGTFLIFQMLGTPTAQW